MYSSKESVNILTSLLVAHGIRHAVVCPGSRNAPIVHNLNECPDIRCYPVTDERSAGFYALGMAQALCQPVVVCVTSGSALLNVAPAVVEAYYQHLSLIVISADRPQAWIDQIDGQTMRQPGVLSPWVGQSVTLPESDPWHCNRLVNEALLETQRDHRPCVHINVPISEPLFQFTTEHLPAERVIRRYCPGADYESLPQSLVDDLLQAERPMVVVGQAHPADFSGEGTAYLYSHVIVLHESLAPYGRVSHFDEVLAAHEDWGDFQPDFVLYVGDAVVSKRLKHCLRQATEARVWRVSTTGRVEDTFQNLRGIVIGDPEFVLTALSRKMERHHLQSLPYRGLWLRWLKVAEDHARTYVPAYSQLAAVKCLEERLTANGDAVEVHYANSTAVRLANIYAMRHVWCNRGVNGIEGSLSTAAGFSLAHPSSLTVCVIGDLSFFYDQNALWNQNLNGNLRILLLNNGKGGIFDHLSGLRQSPAHDRLVAGRHHASAQGVCLQNEVQYLSAHHLDDMKKGIDRLLSADASHPVLLEVFTSSDEDERVLKDYFASFSQSQSDD